MILPALSGGIEGMRVTQRASMLAERHLAEGPVLLVALALLHQRQAVLQGFFKRHRWLLRWNVLCGHDAHFRVYEPEHDNAPDRRGVRAAVRQRCHPMDVAVGPGGQTVSRQ